MTHHTAKVIGITMPVDPAIPSSAALLAYCARVSSTANQHKHETGGGLLRSLVRRQEWSPFEMVNLLMEIRTTRDVARQILRHRSMSFQEFSQRYSAVNEPPVYREARLQDHKDRQNSIETDDVALKAEWLERQEMVIRTADEQYQWALGAGIAKEVARAVLPEGNTVSTMYMNGTVRSYIHYCNLRCDYKTQKEHRILAESIREAMFEQLPDLRDVLA